jgi:uncharacterized membrane protein YjjP (DUF1212 family)
MPNPYQPAGTVEERPIASRDKQFVSLSIAVASFFVGAAVVYLLRYGFSVLIFASIACGAIASWLLYFSAFRIKPPLNASRAGLLLAVILMLSAWTVLITNARYTAEQKRQRAVERMIEQQQLRSVDDSVLPAE